MCNPCLRNEVSPMPQEGQYISIAYDGFLLPTPGSEPLRDLKAGSSLSP
jgi:hypothetical protein